MPMCEREATVPLLVRTIQMELFAWTAPIFQR